MDSSGFNAKLERLRRDLATHLKGAAQQVPFIMQALMAEHFEPGQKQDDKTRWFRSGPRLLDDSGRTQRSFIPGQADNIFEVRTQGSLVIVEYGTKVPYAVMNDGEGEVRLTQIKSKGKMEGFFWGKYKQSQNLFWKILALKVKRDGFLTHKSKPFWTPAVKAFREGKGREMLAKEVLKIIARVWNGR